MRGSERLFYFSGFLLSRSSTGSKKDNDWKTKKEFFHDETS